MSKECWMVFLVCFCLGWFAGCQAEPERKEAIIVEHPEWPIWVKDCVKKGTVKPGMTVEQVRASIGALQFMWENTSGDTSGNSCYEATCRVVDEHGDSALRTCLLYFSRGKLKRCVPMPHSY